MDKDNDSQLSQSVHLDIETAVRLFQSGSLNEADQICNSVLARLPEVSSSESPAPELPVVLSLRGSIAAQSGNMGAAAVYFKQAVDVDPNNAAMLHDYGRILFMAGNFEASLKCFRQAMDNAPDYTPAYMGAANCLSVLDRKEEAIALIKKSIGIDSSSAQSFFNLGILYTAERNNNEALISYRRAVELEPTHARAWNNMGTLLRGRGMYSDAMMCFERALEIKPDFVKAVTNIAVTRHDMRDFPGALEYYERAVVMSPDYAGAHFNRSVCYLMMGDFKSGWKEFNWRWKLEDFSARVKKFIQPAWDGSPASGRTILVYMEQGFGDVFQFARYIPLLEKKGFKVILQCDLRISKIITSISDTMTVVSGDESLPSFDVHVAIMELPAVFQTDIATVPDKVPYLFATHDLATVWEERLAQYTGKRIGICWRGNPEHSNNFNRSCSIEHFISIAGQTGVQLFSLQKPVFEEDRKKLQASSVIVDLDSELDQGSDGFVDTAAVIQNLDLVITVDTSVAHIAGALGKPVWLLLSYVPDWRWMHERDDSPWYPGMRIFRQTEFGEWDAVFSRVESAIDEMVADS